MGQPKQTDFEKQFRQVLSTLASRGKTTEIFSSAGTQLLGSLRAINTSTSLVEELRHKNSEVRKRTKTISATDKKACILREHLIEELADFKRKGKPFRGLSENTWNNLLLLYTDLLESWRLYHENDSIRFLGSNHGHLYKSHILKLSKAMHGWMAHAKPGSEIRLDDSDIQRAYLDLQQAITDCHVFLTPKYETTVSLATGLDPRISGSSQALGACSTKGLA